MKNWEHRHTNTHRKAKNSLGCKQEMKVFKEIMVYDCQGDVKLK